MKYPVSFVKTIKNKCPLTFLQNFFTENINKTNKFQLIL